MPVDVSEPDETFPANRDGLHPDRRVESLTRLPVLSRCSRQELARIVPCLRKKRLQPGEFLCRAGQPTRESWLLLQGTLLIDRAAGESGEVSEGLVGEEAAINARSYLSDIVAKDEATVLVVPKAIIPDVLKYQGNRAHPFWGSLLERFTTSQLSIHIGAGDGVTSTQGSVLYMSRRSTSGSRRSSAPIRRPIWSCFRSTTLCCVSLERPRSCLLTR
jgi:Cyclic nucleotide-binding domain